MSEPVDIAVDLGVVPPALPEICFFEEFVASEPKPPPLIIEGSIMVLTPHEEPDCFTVTSILRNLPQLPEFVVSWDYPLMRVASDLNPEALRRPQSKNKMCSDKEFMEQFITGTPATRGAIVAAAGKADISARTADRYLRKLADSGLIGCGGGLYWRISA